MAMYFHGGPEMQSDSLQTLYLMNPGFAGYSDVQPPANMLLMNSAVNSFTPISLSHNPQQEQQQQQQHLVGIPLQSMAVTAQDSVRPQSMSSPYDIQHNIWCPSAVDVPAQLGPCRPSTAPEARQGISLSLSHQRAAYTYRPVLELPPATAEGLRAPGSSSAASTRISSMQSVVMASKYRTAVQQLLDEVVNVGREAEGEPMKVARSKNLSMSGRDSEGKSDGDTSSKRGAAEKHDLQMKKAKLLNMLDEVEQKYRQYNHQMQLMGSSFEAVAGPRSARSYTSLARRTISKQFRCLRDAISDQIQMTSKSLGEEDCIVGGNKSEGRSGLRFIEDHLRQQRALQQLGIMQHNAWRPQRGLPEPSVSMLRAWLFEHFLHPYPKDSDKLMLAKQTGLTRSQVSNWFINARVRLWKPMVEEMYQEEFKQPDQSNGNDKTTSGATEDSASKFSAQQENSPARTAQTDSPKLKPHTLYGYPKQASYNESDAMMHPLLKKARADDSMHGNAMTHLMNVEMKNNEASTKEAEYPLFTGIVNSGGSFGAYSMGDLGKFTHEQFAPRFSANGVSLSLGLQRCESLSLAATRPSYLSGESIPMGNRLEMGTEADDYFNLNNNNNSPPVIAQASNACESINIQSRKRFAAQLLPDFVA